MADVNLLSNGVAAQYLKGPARAPRVSLIQQSEQRNGATGVQSER
ncbi:hypothetical protein [Pasteuria penetrans]|nr:hypothetical protein [Pasteuria penetrans]